MKLPYSSTLRHTGLGLVFSASFAFGQTPSLDYPQPFTPQPPYDVDSTTLKALNPETQLPEQQRLFDLFAWQTFIALNWPADAKGQPAPKKTLADNTSPRVWSTYREASSVFRSDGQPPQVADLSGAWKQVDQKTWRALLSAGYKPGDRVLWMSRKIQGHGRGVETNESLQAFSGPLIDQNGKWVRYEVLMNNTEYDYIVENQLYNQEGQARFTARNQVSFPANDGNKKPGSMELKLAWKQIDPGTDDPSRFYTVNAWVIPYDPAAANKAGPPYRALMGLVGMHVAVLTQSSPTWVWSTFEQVDTVQANDLAYGTNGKGEKIRLRPLFNNPDLPTKLPNVLPPYTYIAPGATTATDWSETLNTTPVQVIRVIPIPDATEQLNTQVRALLAAQKSVFQHYRLIGTQWPVQPGFPAFSSGMPNGLTSSPESIVFKIPGKVVPVFLVNVTMETFFQKGVQPAGPMADDDRLASGQVSDPTSVFGTESCAGCHFSAGAVVGFKKNAEGLQLWVNPDGTINTTPQAGATKLPIYGQNGVFGQTGNGHFSWLLQMKAQSAEPYTPPAKSGATSQK